MNTNDPRIDIWNVLHDGEITAVTGENSDTLTMYVTIPYLRLRLEPIGGSFVLKLEGLKHFEFRFFDGTTLSLQDELESATIPEILSTESTSMPVTIDTSMGKLVIDFERIQFALDTGQIIKYEAIEKACVDYWTEWKAKIKK